MTPYRSIVALVWPLALGMVNNAVMAFVDRAYLARWSLDALEAVLPASVCSGVFVCFFQAIVGYGSVFVARYHGAERPALCRDAFRASLLLALASGALCGLLVWSGAGARIFAFSSPSDALLALEMSYFDWVTAGAVFQFVQLAAASYFTGRGRTRFVFWVNLGGNLLNIVLDPFLIFGWAGLPALGVTGAAIATVASMAAQGAVLTAAVVRETARLPTGGRCLSIAGGILRFGVPAGAYSVLNYLSFAVFVFVTARLGKVELAVSNACFTVNYLLFAPMEGFALGASTLVAQAKGRGDADGARIDARRTLVLGLAVAAVGTLAALAAADPILALFAAEAGEATARFFSLGRTLFLLMAVWQIFDAAEVILSGALKGAGDTRFVLVWMLIGSFAIWMPLVFAVRACMNTLPALWATLVVDVVVLFVGTAVRWRRGAWRTIRLEKTDV
jgi:MATE family multidrug resistance protein